MCSNPTKQIEVNFQHRGIHIANLNIRHLKPKLDDVKIILDHVNQIDIFGVCETFLNTTIDDITVSINGYNFERKDRDNCNHNLTEKGGGVLIYINNQLNYTRRLDLESSDIESI